MARGRPRTIESPEQFNALVDEYLDKCSEEKRPVTWTGMALHLGFASRQGIDEYQKYAGYSDCVKRAKTLVEMAYEERLHGNSPAGAIFALKNMQWSDKQELDHSSKDGSMQAVDRVTVEVVSAATDSESSE